MHMCIKEVKWTLETTNPLKRASILALSQVLRITMFTEQQDLLNRPFDYSRDELMQFYCALEILRNQSTVDETALQNYMLELGVELPNFTLNHFEISKRALEIWMCTLGAGILPGRRDEVRAIWGYLISATSSLQMAFSQLKNTERLMGEMSGSDIEMFSGIEETEWGEACKYIPEIFIKELRLFKG